MKTKAKSNGHGSAAGIGAEVAGLPREAKGLFGDDSFFENAMTNQEMGGLSRDFTSPGKDPIDLLMRTYTNNDREELAMAQFLKKCRKYDWKEGEDLLRFVLALRRSRKGLSMDQVLQGWVQQLRRDKTELGNLNKPKKKAEDDD